MLSEKQIKSVQAIYNNVNQYNLRSADPQTAKVKEIIEKTVAMLTGEIPFDKSILYLPLNLQPNAWFHFLALTIRLNDRQGFECTYYFEEDHPLIQEVLKPSYFHNPYAYEAWNYINLRLTFQNDVKVAAFIDFLKKQGYTEDEIIEHHMGHPSPLRMGFGQPPTPYNGFAAWVKPLLQPKKGFLGFGGDAGKMDKFLEFGLGKNRRNAEKDQQIIDFLFELNPAIIDDYQRQFLVEEQNGKLKIINHVVRMLLEKDPAKYEPVVLELTNEFQPENHELFEIYLALDKFSAKDYSQKVIELGEAHLQLLENSLGFFRDHWVGGDLYSSVYVHYLVARDREKGKARIMEHIAKSPFLSSSLLRKINTTFGAEGVEILALAVGKESSHHDRYHERLFELLDPYDYSAYLDQVLSFAVNKAGKEDRRIITTSVAKQGEKAIVPGKQLLAGKTVNERIVGAMILAHIDSPDIKLLLADCIDTESNDETRNIILETLGEENQAKSNTLADIKSIIAKAAARKKLNKWNEKVITEESMAPLYWKETGEKLDENEIRFLFYRMKQAKGLNSDPEASAAVRHIDKERSEKLASQLLQAFIDSNSDPKLKYYLTLCGLLGEDSILHKLNVLFKKSITDKRLKMAEYVLGAIAMIGTDKALRILEVVSRKFANKKPNIAQAALDALTAAATELNITHDQLADRIIPDFGFEGMYKTFQAGDETYRAFINGEFKVCFYNESNQLRKSLPPGTDKELTAEFKEIDKEIKDITKTQHQRLEKYMVEERKWPLAEWRKLFFHNPIMFVYATKLLWSLYDEPGNIIKTFYCDEDMETFDAHDEAVDLEQGTSIAILHPADLTNEQLIAWKEKIYNSSLKTIFPILERKVFQKENSELEQNYTRSYSGKDVPKGADYVATHLLKHGWRKESGDSGSLVLTKHLMQPKMYAFANIEGPAVVYQGGNVKATVLDISFHGKHDMDKVLIRVVPDKFYSETIADIDSLVNAN